MPIFNPISPEIDNIYYRIRRDIVAKIESDTMDKLKEIITTNIRGLENVRSTLTMIVIEGANE